MFINYFVKEVHWGKTPTKLPVSFTCYHHRFIKELLNTKVIGNI